MIPRTYNEACDYPWQTEKPKEYRVPDVKKIKSKGQTNGK